AAYLRDMVTSPCSPGSSLLIGARDLVNDGPALTRTGNVIHIDGHTAFAPRTLASLAPPYLSNAPFRAPFPNELAVEQSVAAFGFEDVNNDGISTNAAEAKRTMGAISAEAATEQMLVATLDFLANNPGANAASKPFFAHGEEMLKLLRAAVGPTAITLRPKS